VEESVWLDVDEGLLDYGFDCLLFCPYRGALGSTGGSATACGESRDKGEESAVEINRGRGESSR
jgi:hypothetical protein